MAKKKSKKKTDPESETMWKELHTHETHKKQHNDLLWEESGRFVSIVLTLMEDLLDDEHYDGPASREVVYLRMFIELIHVCEHFGLSSDNMHNHVHIHTNERCREEGDK